MTQLAPRSSEINELIPFQSTEAVIGESPGRRIGHAARFATFLGACSLTGGIIGAFNAFESPAESSVGANEAQVQLHPYGREDTIDLGPLGSLYVPSNIKVAGVPVSLSLAIKSIPDDAVNDKGSFSPTVQAEYMLLLSDPAHEAETIRDDLISHYETGAAKGLGEGALAFLLSAGMWGLAGRDRKEALRRGFKPSVKAAAACSSLALVMSGVAGDATHASHETLPIDHPDHVFDGTLLEGSATTGFVRFAVDGPGSRILKMVDDGNRFAGQAEKDLKVAYEAAGIAPPDDNTTRVMVTSDIHDRQYVPGLAATVSQLYHADILADLGDINFSGNWPPAISIEKTTIANLAKFVKHRNKNIKLVSVLGNHDSEQVTGKWERAHGFTVLENKIETIDGLTFIGSTDPWRSVFGQKTTGPNGRTDDGSLNRALQKQGEELTKTACHEPEPVDIALVHDPVDEQLEQSGCARFIMNGHLHVRRAITYLTAKNGLLVHRFQMGTTGGAKPVDLKAKSLEDIGISIVGIPGRDITMTVIDFDKTTGEAVSSSDVTITPQGVVSVTPMRPIPNPRQAEPGLQLPGSSELQTGAAPTPSVSGGELITSPVPPHQAILDQD